MTSIFLSYARGDDGEPFDPATSYVARLHRDLTDRGIDVWFDRVSMPSRNLTFHQEIRDAVSACDRLLLVVGPKAVSSDYVRQEWQFAYFQADKVVTPILRQGNFPLVPDELKLLHCEDFRDDAQYAFHLEQLTRILRALPPQLGKLIGVPSLPTHFLSRTARLVAIRDALRADLDRPVFISGAAARVGVHGMGGIGKSVLASALAHDRKIREAFPDGIVWVGMGPLPSVAELQRRVHRELGGDGAIVDEHEGRTKLKDLLADKSVLLVIDDVWRRGDVDAFNVLGPRCRAMITTRDAGLLTSLGGTHHVVELLTDEEAFNLFAHSSGVARDALPHEAREIIAECGRLPLAVSLAGGMIQAGTRWQDVLDALREHELEFLEDEHEAFEQHRNLWKMIEVSVQVLPEDDQRRLSDLAVFPTDEAISETAVTTLWEHTGSLSPRQARQLLVKLKQRSLVQLMRSAETAADTVGTVSLHDLIHDFCVRLARREFGDDRVLHTRLLHAYQTKCPDGWASGPNDGYFFTHLRDHLVAAGRGSELAEILQDLRWLEAKNDAGLVFDLSNDFSDAQEVLSANDSHRRILRLLEEALGRDIHFINRHRENYPQALFQCLWNSCWWYDCPEAAQHYDPPVAGWPPEGAPWERSGRELSQLLESWRAARTAKNVGPIWLRSLRPPAIPIDGPQRHVFSGHEYAVHSVSFSPDGRRIASASGDWTVCVWDAVSGCELARLMGHEDGVTSVAFSPDGSWIVSGSKDSSVRVWEADSGHQLNCIQGHTGGVNSVAFCPDGCWIASGSDDKTVSLWEPASGFELASMTGHEWPVQSVAFSPDGGRVASGSVDGTVRVWDTTAGAQLAVLLGHPDPGFVNSVSYSPDGTRIVSGSSDNTVRVWDATSGVQLAILRGHKNSVESVSFSPDGTRIVSGSADKTVRLWDAGSGHELARLTGHDDSVSSVAFSPDGRRIASGSEDRTVRVWDAEGNRDLPHRKGHEGYVNRVAYSPDGRRIVSESFGGTVCIWDAESGRLLTRLAIRNRRVTSVILSSNARRIASGLDDNTVCVWDAEGGQQLARLKGHDGGVTSVAFSPNGLCILSGSEDASVRIWDAVSGRQLACLTGHGKSVTSVVFSPDGQRIASASDDRTIRLWDAGSGQQLASLSGDCLTKTVTFSADGRRIASALFERPVQSVGVWDVASGRQLARVCLKDQNDHVNHVAFSPNGRWIAADCTWQWYMEPGKRTMRVWDVDEAVLIQEIQGGLDVAAIAAGRLIPCRAIRHGQHVLETVFESTEEGEEIAWYPIPFQEAVTHLPGRVWAATSKGDDVHLLTLEGVEWAKYQKDPSG